MPYPNYHSARLQDPDNFDKFRTQEKEKGVKFIFGIKGEEESLQSLRFPKEIFTVEETKAFLEKENLNPIEFEEAIKEDACKKEDGKKRSAKRVQKIRIM
jgi:hypothetical protein